MREIKFVVWDKKNKRMWSEVTDIYWRDRKIASIRGLTHYNDADNQPIGLHEDYGDIEETLILLQYIGHKDKNEKEIYEGHIIRINDEPDYNCSVVEDITNIQHIKGFIEKNRSVEIIGNIYENPELLE